MPPVIPPRQLTGDRSRPRLDEQETAPCGTAAAKAEAQPSAVAAAAAGGPPQISDVFRDVLATLERPPLRPASPEKAQAPTADTSWSPAVAAAGGPWSADWCQTSVGMAEPLSFAQPIVLAESVGLVDPAFAAEASDQEAAVSDEQSAVGEQQSAINNQQSAIDNHPLPVAHLSSFPQLPPSAESPAPPAFKPAWQVERFTWPRVCRRLTARAAEEFDRLADALLAANARGQKVLAMAACCRGESATTLLLCAARRLAERGVKLVLVDADLARPRLAKRLGVEMQSGWNETPDHDATFLANAVIEAAANNVALSAIREPKDEAGPAAIVRGWPPGLDILKGHYEMVLVDLGPLENTESLGDNCWDKRSAARSTACCWFTIRGSPRGPLWPTLKKQLTAAGVPLAGLIENFVAS